MLAPAAPITLTLIECSSPKARMEGDGIHSEFVVGRFEAENQAKLEQLERDRNDLGIIGVASGTAGIIGFSIFAPSALVWFPTLWKLADTLAIISRRYLLMTELIEAFEAEDAEILVGLQPEDASEIDFFLRFPDKEFVLLHICSAGTQARVNFSLSKQALQIRRKGGLKTIKPNPITEMLKQERWIRNYRTELLGASSRDRRRSIAKVIVFWDQPTIPVHPEHLYATINDQKYLYVTTEANGSAFVIQREQVVNFIHSYLKSKRSRKSS